MTRTPSHFTERRHRIARLDRMAERLDARFRIPGIGLRFGWDSILGLIPGLGDAITAIPGLLIIYEGTRQGVRMPVLARMGANTALDLMIGSLPLIGDAFDVVFKSHRRNMTLLKAELPDIRTQNGRRHGPSQRYEAH